LIPSGPGSRVAIAKQRHVNFFCVKWSVIGAVNLKGKVTSILTALFLDT
jgi:hypothetical protein